MSAKISYSIGLMSGTSLDGVDLVYVSFDISNDYAFKIHCCETIPYSSQWLKTLKDAFFYSKKNLDKLDIVYGNYLADLIVAFIDKNKINKLDFIASHGHTIHHKPSEGYTRQIGDGKTIAHVTKIRTINNFRAQDVAYGGQGAPLVPIGDKWLFSEFYYCLNLGGFANNSYESNNQRIAYDICAVNTVLNHYAHKLNLDYDDKGHIAKTGRINDDLLNELNALSFYKQTHPKSLGFEFVDEVLLPMIAKHQLSEKDVLRTFVEHVAIQIGSHLSSDKKVLVTGGGVFNTFLMDRIAHFATAKIHIPTHDLINYKEALIFSFLGLRRLENKINCLQSVTGANKDHCSGVVFE